MKSLRNISIKKTEHLSKVQSFTEKVTFYFGMPLVT